MAWTQTDIDKLKSAMASGVLTVRHGETSTTFQSLADMQKQLERMEAEVNGATNVPRRRSVASYSGGF